MRKISGEQEIPGAADSPMILGMAGAIAAKFPAMANYCRAYTHDSIPWCGLTIAYVMAVNGIAPQYRKLKDLESFLWADAWKDFGVPCEPTPGAVMVFTRNGGGHVSLYEGENSTHYVIRGGNQSDMINVMFMPKSKFTASRWPANVPIVPVPGVYTGASVAQKVV